MKKCLLASSGFLLLPGFSYAKVMPDPAEIEALYIANTYFSRVNETFFWSIPITLFIVFVVLVLWEKLPLHSKKIKTVIVVLTANLVVYLLTMVLYLYA